MMYLYKKAREEHYHDLQREMEKNRSLAHRPRSRLHRSRRVAGKLGVLLLKLGARLEQFEQARLTPQLHFEDIGQFETPLHAAQNTRLLRSDFSPLIQMTLILQICQAYLASLPLYRAVMPGEDVSSASALARGREYIVALIVHRMLVDLKDDEAEETREREGTNRPEARNEDTQ